MQHRWEEDFQDKANGKMAEQDNISNMDMKEKTHRLALKENHCNIC